MTVILAADSVRVEFGPLVAVDNVSFELSGGQLLGLVGPNGAGKSTILHLITGRSACSEGGVTVLGQPARGNPELYRDIGVMSEHEAVYGFYTGREFIEFTARLHGLNPIAGPVDRAIEMVGLEDAQGRRLDAYSRGMRQRMRLAAALVHDPQVLVLDEPLNGTDPR